VRKADVTELRRLAGEAGAGGRPPATLWLLTAHVGRRGEAGRAAELLRDGLRRHPGDFWLHFELAYVLSDLGPGQAGEAARHYTAALALRPESAVVHNNLGLALKDQGDLVGAVACYREALRLDPKLALAHNNLGNALRARGDLDGAVACYKEALRLDPKHAPAHFNLGFALRRQGRFAESLTAFRRGHELGSRNPRWPYPKRSAPAGPPPPPPPTSPSSHRCVASPATPPPRPGRTARPSPCGRR
jgi:Flp pilus assembly protein TadD